MYQPTGTVYLLDLMCWVKCANRKNCWDNRLDSVGASKESFCPFLFVPNKKNKFLWHQMYSTETVRDDKRQTAPQMNHRRGISIKSKTFRLSVARVLLMMSHPHMPPDLHFSFRTFQRLISILLLRRIFVVVSQARNHWHREISRNVYVLHARFEGFPLNTKRVHVGN